MKSLRIVLTQASANFKREETIDNAMTYPLPPLSTVAGALHSICGYKECKDMDISIQGEFTSKHNKYYRSITVYNSILDDRGILVKMSNSNSISSAYTKVARSLKQNSSYKHDKDILILNNTLYQEYISLITLISDEKSEKQLLLSEMSSFVKESDNYEFIKNKIAVCEEQKKKYVDALARFKCIEYIPKNVEILNSLFLIIHVRADIEILEEILLNINNMKCLGRSEDFVDVINAQLVELHQDTLEVICNYSSYININDVRNKCITNENNDSLKGTIYYLTKKYNIIDSKRVFERAKVLYTSCYKLEKFSNSIYVDKYNNQNLIVNFN